MSVHVKICGITTVADARLAVQAGADLIGLNFYPPSPRYISESTAKMIRSILPQHVRCVGIFVNAERAHIAAYVRALSLDVIQFHGDEDAAALTGWPVATVKAVRVDSETSLPEQLEGITADYFLLDTYSSRGYGGTGETFGLGVCCGPPSDVLGSDDFGWGAEFRECGCCSCDHAAVGCRCRQWC